SSAECDRIQPGCARTCAGANVGASSSSDATARNGHRRPFASGDMERFHLCGCGEQIGIDEIVALHALSGKYGDGSGKHRACESKGVELAALAAGIDGRRKIGEELRIEGAAGEGCIEMPWVDAGEMRAQAGGDHLPGEFGGREAEVGAPDGKDGFEAGSGEPLDAVGADVFEEEIAESNAVQAFGGGASADGGHAGFVVGVGAGKGQVDFPHWKTGRFRLQIEQLFAETVHCDAAELLIDGCEECDNLVVRVLAKEVQRPG